jgi:hypothetical protein
VFILAHEMSHLVGRHPQRFKHYAREGSLRGKPWVQEHANICADLVINADLVDTGVGTCNPDWLYDPQIKASELWEDVYERTLKVIKQPPPPPRKGKGEGDGGQQSIGTAKTFAESGKAIRGAKGDARAKAEAGRFDTVLDPPVDPATGGEDLPDESEFKEAIARAAAAARAMGKMPAGLQRMVDEILAPQVDWRDHIRMLVTGKIGQRGETWARPNRRRLALNPIVVMPGKRGYGADTVVVAVDTSGSIGSRALAAFLAEVGGILNDCKPRRIVVIGCDARISQVDEVTTLDEFEGLREKGLKGGGGTDFRPVTAYVEEHQLRPETLIYLTDGLGTFDPHAPPYPMIWAMTTDVEPPWGEVVRLQL